MTHVLNNMPVEIQNQKQEQQLNHLTVHLNKSDINSLQLQKPINSFTNQIL